MARHLRQRVRREFCPVCGSVEFSVNRIYTLSCDRCRYITTASGNISRRISHLLIGKYTFVIRPRHPDVVELGAVTFTPYGCWLVDNNRGVKK